MLVSSWENQGPQEKLVERNFQGKASTGLVVKRHEHEWSSLTLAQKAQATVPYMLSQCKNENTQKLAQVDLGNCDLKKPNWQHNSPRQSHGHGYNDPVRSTSDVSAQEPDNLTSVIFFFVVVLGRGEECNLKIFVQSTCC